MSREQELAELVRKLCNDYEDMRIAFFSYPGSSDGRYCPLIDQARAAIAFTYAEAT